MKVKSTNPYQSLTSTVIFNAHPDRIENALIIDHGKGVSR